MSKELKEEKKYKKEMALGFKANKESREKALEFPSPDTSKMIGVRLDKDTMIYFKPGTSQEKIEERMKLYKKSRQSWQ
jgi:hypothetical protein